MEFRAHRDDFADAVAWVARSLPSRPPVPVLGGILLAVTDQSLQVSGFDYEVSTQAELNVDATTAGRVLVSGKLLAQIVSALPSKPVDVALVDHKVTIKCGSSRFSLPAMPVEDYPVLPDMPTASGTVDAAAFYQAVAQTAAAAGKDDTLPMLTGIRLEIEGESLTLAATDRFRLAVKELTWSPTQPDIATAVLIPARTLADIAKTVGGQGEVSLALGDGLVGISAGDRRTTVRLLDVEFVKYRSLLPTEHTTTVTVEVAELANAIKRVALVTDRGHHLRMNIADGTLSLAAGGEDEGTAEESLAADLDGDDLLIAFNPTYLTDGLAVLGTSAVRLALTSATRPALLLPVDDDKDDYQYLVMPARLPG